MPDDIMREPWDIKDSIAREHGYDIDALVAHLQSKPSPEGQQVVDLRAMKDASEQGAPARGDGPRR